jgi:hypothetical protein
MFWPNDFTQSAVSSKLFAKKMLINKSEGASYVIPQQEKTNLIHSSEGQMI